MNTRVKMNIKTDYTSFAVFTTIIRLRLNVIIVLEGVVIHNGKDVSKGGGSHTHREPCQLHVLAPSLLVLPHSQTGAIRQTMVH